MAEASLDLLRSKRCRHYGLLPGLLLLCGLAQGEVYRWEDPAGGIHYGERQVAGARRLELNQAPSYYRVEKVYDGDTLFLSGNKRVRLLGINSPEVESRRRAGEPGGEQARNWLRQWLEGKKVRLELDRSREDKYQRILAHVFTEQGDHVNLGLVEAGLAVVTIHPPDLKYSAQLLQAQHRAEADRRGIWGFSAYAPRPLSALQDAFRHGWQRIVATPESIQRGRRYIRLQLSDYAEVRIPKENLELFPPLQGYIGHSLEIRGWPSRRKDHFSILILHPSALVAVAS